MGKMVFKWILNKCEDDAEERYCHNCSKKVIFRDSGQRRLNANGKDLYEFAIFKCEKGHTWNKTLGKYKSNKAERRTSAKEQLMMASQIDIINIDLVLRDGINEIEILIEEVEGKWRLDKLLSQQIHDVSRTKIESLINCGNIQVNNQIVKPKLLLKKGYVINILI